MARLNTTTLVSALIFLPHAFVTASPNHVQRSYADGKAVSPDGRCGGVNGYTCKGYIGGGCCSPCGKCGSDAKHCGKGCQDTFGSCHIQSSLGTETGTVSVVSTDAASSSLVVTSTTSGAAKASSDAETTPFAPQSTNSGSSEASGVVNNSYGAQTISSAKEATTSPAVVESTTAAAAEPTTSIVPETTSAGPTISADMPTTTAPPSLPSSAAAGRAHSTTVSSCPPTTPSGTVVYESTDDAAIEAGFPYVIYQDPVSDSALQLVADLSEGTPVLFDFSRTDSITGTFQNSTSFTLNLDGSFRYVHAGCDFEIDGVVGGKRKRASRLDSRGSLGSAAVTVDVFDMCGRPFEGQAINIQCMTNNLISENQYLTDVGGGAYTGSCAIEYTDSPLCHVADMICDTEIGAQIRASDHTFASCKAIADLAGEAAAPGTADAVSSSVLAACTGVLDLVGGDLCNSFDATVPTGGDNCQVPEIDLYMYAEAIDGFEWHTVTDSRLTVAPTGAPAVTATLSVGRPCSAVVVTK